MPRGGERKGAGRPSTWKSGCKFEDTKLIRVPSAIADKVLKFAHELDDDEILNLAKSGTGSLGPLEASQLELLSVKESSWRLGSTVRIEVPVALRNRLLAIAEQLDREELSQEKQGNLKPPCPRCRSTRVYKDGFTKQGKQKYECQVCERKFVEPAK